MTISYYDDFVVREPYNKDNGRFIEIELSEDEYRKIDKIKAV